MNSHRLTLNQTAEHEYECEINGYPLTLKSNQNEEGKAAGITPKKLLLAALTGCTAIDVAGMLKTMRVTYTDFSVSVSSELNSEHPVVYQNYDLIYTIRVQEKDRSKVEKAVKLSKEKYCGVSAMLHASAPISYVIEFL